MEKVDVRARVRGFLQSVNFEPRAKVQKGQLLFIIDPSEYQAKYDPALAALVTQALDMALQRRRPGAGLLHHSDRGCQYASGLFRRLLSDHGLVCSMSRKGNAYDNAPMESFFSSFKRERAHQVHYATRSQARTDVFEYIEVFYNRQRLHSSLGYRSPADFEAQGAFS